MSAAISVVPPGLGGDGLGIVVPRIASWATFHCPSGAGRDYHNREAQDVILGYVPLPLRGGRVNSGP